jgi:hypothetical protein
VVNTRMALATTRKGSLSVVEYLTKMQALGNDMAMAGKPLDDEDLVQYILAGLDQDIDSMVNSVLARPQAITVSKHAAQMLAFESQVDLRNGGSGSSANFAHLGRGGFGRGGGRGRGSRGGHTPASVRGNQGSNLCQGGCTGNNSGWPQCQVCLKYGHTADRCWYRFVEDFVPEQCHTAAAATSSYTVDTNWYADSGTTDHITSELDKLTIHDKYNGGEKVHTVSGAGMEISHIGKSFIHTPIRNLQLCNILHVPKATKNLMSIHRFALDNNVFFEIHP